MILGCFAWMAAAISKRLPAGLQTAASPVLMPGCRRAVRPVSRPEAPCCLEALVVAVTASNACRERCAALAPSAFL